jgi:hypothetical protein
MFTSIETPRWSALNPRLWPWAAIPLLCLNLVHSADTNDWNHANRIQVRCEGDRWQIVGERHRLEGSLRRLDIRLQSRQASWPMTASRPGDLRVRTEGKVATLQLASAAVREVAPYATGYSRGVKLRLHGFAVEGRTNDLALQILLTLEGPAEDVVCELLATDGEARVAELRWPGGVESASFDHTVVPFMQGMLLPKHWPEKVWLYDTLSFGRGLYMPWWGHQQGESALLAILETPEDAGCHFEHPEGGPTHMGPRWVDSLGRWSHPRRMRFVALEPGNYVTLAKRYRQHAREAGRWVSLRDKIAGNPMVERLVGKPVIHTSILYHIQPDSSYYDPKDPAKNHQLVTFAARAAELEQLSQQWKAGGYLHLDGWGVRGYDNLHPDPLPPGEEAGGWSGMQAFSETCERLGFVFAIHDQYRDYYLDAPSYDPRHTLLHADGSRPQGSTWYGGKQSILCSRFAPGYVRRNHEALRESGVRLRGAYLDVFAVVPPDECYAPEHPVTRAECLRYRAQSLDSVRLWGGVASSEEPSDWAIPHMDLVHHGPYALRPNPGQGPAMGMPVPLFNLVYHECLLTPWSLGRGEWGIPEKDLGYLHGLGNAGLPYLSLHPSPEHLEQVRTLCALHARVGLLELTDHRFTASGGRKQTFVYADGTRVSIDLEGDTFQIDPPLP